MDISELEIWKSARMLIALHGADARLFADTGVKELGERGDAQGVSFWGRIGAAIAELDVMAGSESRVLH